MNVAVTQHNIILRQRKLHVSATNNQPISGLII